PAAGKADHLGCGQHGGLARYEQMPFLMIEGPGFMGGTVTGAPTSPIDLAPTILAHLDQPGTGMDGRPLQATSRTQRGAGQPRALRRGSSASFHIRNCGPRLGISGAPICAMVRSPSSLKICRARVARGPPPAATP